MSTITVVLIALFLILFGITALVSTSIPAWVTGLLALLAGIACLVEGFTKYRAHA